ncbi:hypothetical protein B0F90DRAFT_1045037 [Multifurca ochricompacta]|uniref:Uncharacterized protein n=1 Tax=Multifurca ochricompacta TaxID=376703 RepID=A0AAD4LZ62_9AGAM|nr:hypothetical protein B0F90DRAFT_1045037 [Multifurca ochricompacta]
MLTSLFAVLLGTSIALAYPGSVSNPLTHRSADSGRVCGTVIHKERRHRHGESICRKIGSDHSSEGYRDTETLRYTSMSFPGWDTWRWISRLFHYY